MVASLLSKCGIVFGSPDELMPANHANILGYFEHQEIAYKINDAILKHFGGSWDAPPKLRNNWQTDPELEPLRKKAISIIARFENHSCWALKDPRVSLLIPFWNSVNDRFKYIICLRNPLDVALSLNKRDGIPLSDGAKIWRQYTESALKHTNDENKVVVFYENFFTQPRQELIRVLNFIEAPFQEKHLDVCDNIFSNMRHHQSTTADLERNEHIDDKSKALFLSIRNEISQDLAPRATATEDTSKTHAFSSKESVHYISAVTKGFLSSSQIPICFPKFTKPIVSIIIPTFNRVDLLTSCIRSVLEYTKIAYELIIVNDASTDETPKFLDSLVNVTIINNSKNLDFLKSANLGAIKSRGEYLIFLNNDVVVRPKWASTLVDTFERTPSCGAVGTKLISMDGKLQEAGSFLREDGSVELYGFGDNPFEPEYSFVRETDYCSAACLLVATKLFLKIGMFDDRYAPAYYEDVDLCTAIWASGHKVIFQPSVMTFHHQMGSRTHEKALSLCQKNRPIFYKKWKKVLKRKKTISSAFQLRHTNKHTELAFIGGSMPRFSAELHGESSYNHLIKLTKQGYAITYLPTLGFFIANDATKYLQQAGVEVFYGSNFKPDDLLRKRAGTYMVIVISDECDKTHYQNLTNDLFPNATILNEHAYLKLSN